MGNCASEPKTNDYASPAPMFKNEELTAQPDYDRDAVVNTKETNGDKQPSLGALLKEEAEKVVLVPLKPKEKEVVVMPKEMKIAIEPKEEKEKEEPKTTTEKKEEIVVEQVKAHEAEIKSVPTTTITQEDKTFDEEKKLVEETNEIKTSAKKEIDEIKKPAEEISDIKKPVEEIVEIKKPTNGIVDVKKPVEQIRDIEKPTEAIHDIIKKPIEEVKEIDKKLEDNNEIKKTEEISEIKNLEEINEEKKPKENGVEIKKPEMNEQTSEKPDN